MEPTLEIKMVRENLALAIALWAGTKRGLISRVQLPAGRIAVPSDDGRAVKMPNPLRIVSNKDLARCLNNQVRGAVALSAMHTHNTLERFYRTPPLQESDPDLRAARCVIGVLSNSLGKGMLAPVWDCPPDYRQRFEVRSISFVLDASTLDGKPVFWHDFGGLEKYLALLEHCIVQIEQSPPEPHQAKGVASEVSAADNGQLSLDLPGDDSVAPFVAAACVTGSEARVIAHELYSGYREWCQGAGIAPLVQRSFGLRLTRLGFVRKRRGRGRHWWMGIELAVTANT